MLACLAEEARRRGAKELTGWYLPTKKNTPVRDFYAKHGFTQVKEHQGSSLWKFDLRQGQIVAPPWIQCKFIQMADVLG
jgi:predicted enzyme involved in methoxymalonyl-ACP biosynthesis